MLLGWFQRKKQNDILRSEVAGCTVYLFFPSALKEDSFTAFTMKQLAERPQNVVFIVSPYAWSIAGVGGKGFYINARREANHLFLLRRHYFFFFRRLLSEQTAKRIVAIL